MLRSSREDDAGKKNFRFRPTFFGEAIEIQWEGDLAYLPSDMASALVYRGYARNLTDDEIDMYSILLEDAETSAENSTEQEDAETSAESVPERSRRGRPPKSVTQP
jgi:hypothetical protein